MSPGEEGERKGRRCGERERGLLACQQYPLGGLASPQVSLRIRGIGERTGLPSSLHPAGHVVLPILFTLLGTFSLQGRLVAPAVGCGGGRPWEAPAHACLSLASMAWPCPALLVTPPCGWVVPKDHLGRRAHSLPRRGRRPDPSAGSLQTAIQPGSYL